MEPLEHLFLTVSMCIFRF